MHLEYSRNQTLVAQDGSITLDFYQFMFIVGPPLVYPMTAAVTLNTHS